MKFSPLPHAACIGHIFPELNKSLISVKQFCDSGCTVLFTKPKAYVSYLGKIILVATICPTTGLWLVPLSTSPQNACNIVTSPTKLADMVAFSHATLFSPAISTLQQALDNGYITGFPGLTSANLKKFPPQSIAMHKGHMDQSRKNQRSTKPAQNIDLDSILFPQPLPTGARTNFCYAATYPLHELTGQASSDLTGKFPVTSNSGNAYLFILYDYDSNCIFPIPIKNRTAESILEAFKTAHADLVRAGHRPKLQKLDNECSQILKDFMHQEDLDFQLAPPGMHRRVAAERAIRTFKNHFIAGLSSVDPNFPMRLWDKLIPQAFITMNLLRGSRINPKLSAYAQIKGPFDFNKTPLAPPGIKVVVHEKPQNRATWDAHGVDGFYLGPAMESYRCYHTFISKTRGERITDTLEWFPKQLKMPTSSNVELLIAATKDLTQAIKQQAKNSPLDLLTDSEHETLDQLNKILSNKSDLLCDPSSSATPPAEPLRVTFQDDPIDNEPPAPPLRVPIPATPLRVPVVTQPVNPPEPEPHIITQEDPPETIIPEAIPESHFTFNKILSHTRAPRGSGSKYQVNVEWTGNHAPSNVPTNTFTDHHTNIQAMESLAEYAQQHNLLNTSGWKCYKEYLPAHTANSATDTPSENFVKLTNQQKHFFRVALHSANKAVHPDTGELSEYIPLLKSSDGVHWELACCEEIGRLAQGDMRTNTTGTDTIHFIRLSDIPTDRQATYLRLVVADRPNKAKPYRVRFTVGGDKVKYPGDVSTKTAEMTTAKIVINSTISTEGARFMGMDIKDFYLNTPMPRYEYMFIPVKVIPKSIFDQYNLEPLVHNGKVYVEIRKGMYGLPQAGRIANDKLIPILSSAGYHQSEHTPGLFKHESRPIAFCLVVDDFGVKYVGKEHALHLLKTLEDAGYVVTTDWEGKQFCGIDLAWDYTNGTVDLSMPGYVEKALQRFNHPNPPSAPEDSPHTSAIPQYGAKTQFTPDPDNSAPLDKKGITLLQEVVGTLLYYARAIDNTMLVTLGTLAAAQSKGTKATAEACKKLLNYAATHPDAEIRYIASDMILHVHSDASYLSESQARSRAGGFFFLSDKTDLSDPDCPTPKINGAVHIISSILNNVMASATEAEVGALFHNAQDACSLRTTLDFLGHPQPATPIQTDNSCAEGIINDTVKQRRSKAIDMRFYWVRDRVRQGQFRIHWKPGQDNLADYFTKHHPASHHRSMRPIYLHTTNLALVRFTPSHREGVLIDIPNHSYNDLGHSLKSALA